MTDSNKIRKGGDRGFIQIEVAPKKLNSSLWEKIKSWFYRFSETPSAIKSRKKVEEYLRAVDKYSSEHLNNPSYLNEKLQAEINYILQQSESANDENRRAREFEGLEYEKIAAEIRKTNAEAFQIESETALEIFREFSARGFDVALKFDPESNRITVINSKHLHNEKLSAQAQMLSERAEEVIGSGDTDSYKKLTSGQKIEFEIDEGPKGLQARKIRKISS